MTHRLIAADRVLWRPAPRTSAASRIAFIVWAVAFALGVLFHEWQASEPAWSVHTVTVTGAVAIAVLLRPSAVWRTVLLGATLAVECLLTLPVPYNHALLASVAGGAIALWWLCSRCARRLRRGTLEWPSKGWRRSCGVGMLVSLFVHWFALLNTGFLNPITTCAPGILDTISLLGPPRELYRS